MSLSKSKFWYSNNCLHSFKARCSVVFKTSWPTSTPTVSMHRRIGDQSIGLTSPGKLGCSMKKMKRCTYYFTINGSVTMSTCLGSLGSEVTNRINAICCYATQGAKASIATVSILYIFLIQI